jgi:hypothetical protein
MDLSNIIAIGACSVMVYLIISGIITIISRCVIKTYLHEISSDEMAFRAILIGSSWPAIVVAFLIMIPLSPLIILTSQIYYARSESKIRRKCEAMLEALRESIREREAIENITSIAIPSISTQVVHVTSASASTMDGTVCDKNTSDIENVVFLDNTSEV